MLVGRHENNPKYLFFISATDGTLSFMRAGKSQGELMRVSQIFKLGRSQPSLDFVDVRTDGDTPLFISPRALASVPSPWGHQCVLLVQSFFSSVIDLIKSGDDATAEYLLSALKEPNETHLGLSQAESRGRALGDESAHRVWMALQGSEAAKTGLLRDLEETALLIPGISVDIISDITTNIIRGPLIDYTQRCADIYGIPLQDGMASGPMWDPKSRDWVQDYVRLPKTPEGKLLLVPKAIVRRSPLYNLNEYYRHHLLEELRLNEFRANTSLVRVLKDGTRELPYKNKVAEKYGSKKEDVIRETLANPHVFEGYKSKKEKEPYSPLPHEQLADTEDTAPPDWEGLLQNVLDIPVGREHAIAYEKAVEALLSALFYPDLTNPLPQSEIHDGRKRIDITYTNVSDAGFFYWLANHYPSAFMFIECKNYGSELANPELDQIAGRFSPSRGQVGIVVARAFKDKKKFLDRCKDTANDHRGFVLVLDDQDLRELVRARINDIDYRTWSILWTQMRQLVS